MPRGLRALTMVLALVAAASVGLRAQSRVLSGTVLDPAGRSVPAATVTVVTTAGATVASTSTDGEGRFTLRVDAAASPAEVRIERPRFEPSRLAVPADDAPMRVVLALERWEEQVSVSPLVVDATTVDSFGASRTVVTDLQVEQLNAVDLASALRRTPGVTISRFNPVGAFGGESGGAVFVRGTGMSRPGSELKTYVDGVPFYMGIWGHPLLDLLPVSSLDAVQVHKGPQPEAFGNAFAAIDLSTRRARGEGVGASLRASAGSFSTVVQQAEVSGRAGAWDFAVAQGFARSDGHRPAADGRLANLFVRLGWRIAPGWTVAATALAADNDASDPGVVGQPDTRAGRFGTSGTLATLSLAHVGASVNGSLQAYANRGEGNWRGQPPPDGDTFTRFALSGVRWREEVLAWAGVHVSAGLDVDRIDGDVRYDTVPPVPPSRFEGDTLTIVGPHVAADRVVPIGGTWSIQPSAGVRVYDHSVFPSAASPHAGLVVRAGGVLAARVSYARGLSYPGQEVVALSGLIPPLGQSWRQLEAEQVDHVEVGVALTPRRGTSVDAAVFHDEYARRYVFAFPPRVARPTFLNLGAHTVRGLDVSVQQDLGAGWRAFVGGTLLDASIPSLPYLPERSIVAALTGRFGPLQLAVDVQHQSAMTVLARARTATAVNPQQVDGFTVVNARPSVTLPRSGGRADLFVAVENLFDTTYAYRPGYPMPGASVQVGVALRAGRR
ncbi:TonB-dependent receptor [Luteitalea sp. TBR-22]|uniref:TonB-dependent receptor n=1 Tax=Luteitalea sp. TBR-22 TaxID=2802971 RepID=UPI001AFB3FCA|nr:TonB-dependent receptor [Luteitalea sp. TBR-22]BCS34415.1 TonB-dependent receptor [Luteitalea sp. TBR-22]